MAIDYRRGNDLDLGEVIDLYRRSTLGDRRPASEPDRVAAMLANANLVYTAWEGDRLVGIARAFSDFAYVTYLADLAVDAAYQRQGLGRELIRLVREAAGERVTLVLLAAPAAERYYPRVGFQHAPQCWVLREGDALR